MWSFLILQPLGSTGLTVTQTSNLIKERKEKRTTRVQTFFQKRECKSSDQLSELTQHVPLGREEVRSRSVDSLAGWVLTVWKIWFLFPFVLYGPV